MNFVLTIVLVASWMVTGCSAPTAVQKQEAAPSVARAMEGGETNLQPPRALSLAWNYFANPDIRFIVQSSTTLAVPVEQWPVRAITETNGMPFEPTNQAEFFVVRASNTVTGEVSGYGKTR
jgi:hypothetical protein